MIINVATSERNTNVLYQTQEFQMLLAQTKTHKMIRQKEINISSQGMPCLHMIIIVSGKKHYHETNIILTSF